MYASRIRAAGLAVAATLGLSACMSPYGYSGVGVGIGSGGYYGDYGYGGYGYVQEQPKAARGRKRKAPVAVVPDTAPTFGELGFDTRREARDAGDSAVR